MGKKNRSGNKSKNSAPAAEAEVGSGVDDTVNPAPQDTTAGDAPAEASLESENTALRADLQDLKAQLSAKDQEIEELKAALENVKSVPATLSAPAKSTEEMGALQERLSKLKKDQQEADAARDMAWSELKRCVQEVAKLANAGLKESQSITST
eukprot:CAMPEP_0177768738 /NCGR_PEP_ID=MMETSP0491_2-20121128/9893_1 /TAXON_ID=63592 /ORGANISM="Tetraselmis chuii, Strain PLY429" /LENGTH=152 /DNA_ID=CAMNT_0019285589 /DNA_START=170 /DNA_END=628 /DNA_ORIENTATION=+